ncbi:MAG TPA: histidine kinase [Gordonia sp. (in: high G+C Gram-positive bacteria)]|uniref:sensor histidine kinase n=1 Tax=unclassified Gordonia (in: high G+C Gram-positive bacteria) TaxID=2657482 RepID=UPI000FAB3147|nr:MULTISPECIES: sensor histidine kinase [unclassified Gordonia (in: high G+C Gram-positive bacteria)]RUP36604.1 MAG: sensor histidine kinase [Gordonia sp. (in: high G+C Gram-positive bacteria)]HNP56013.1 histidine kinase [Gordonia sp. (in: high G+C Gram-positive bacteria)]HRC51914.1 histidine kinase [Gordonia sp. (in: high G+C Gram-positive bacteria)]
MAVATFALDPTPDLVARWRIGVVPTASMLLGALIGVVWFWIPLGIAIVALSSIPSVIGFLLAGVVFIYLMRGVEWMERLRSEAVFGMGIGVPPRTMSEYAGFQGWAHQLWLDLSSARFWKGVAHHYLRMTVDIVAGGFAFALVVFAFLGPAAATAIRHSDADAGLEFLPPPLAWLVSLVAIAVATAIMLFTPALDAVIDRWLLSPSPTAALRHQVDALADARQGAVSSAEVERYRIERDLHDSVQPRLVSLAMTIGLARTKLDTDPGGARALIDEAHDDAKSALVELRNVVRGIAPTILADRGLDAALSSVVGRAETSGVPTSLNVDLPRRLPAEVEAVAYFVVAEALTNVAKHAGATRTVVTVILDETDDVLCVSVFDDGRGGAAIEAGDNATGLMGLAERVRAAGGVFDVSSPITGPTIVTAVLPCAS